MAQIKKRDITNVNMNLPTPMVLKVKEYANNLGLPITQAYVVLINMALEHKDTLNAIPRLLELAENYKLNQSSELESDD